MKEIRRFKKTIREVKGVFLPVENIIYDDQPVGFVVIFDLCNGVGTRIKIYPTLSEATTAARWPIGGVSC